MKQIFFKNIKKFILGLSAALSFVIFVIMLLVCNSLGASLDTQSMAKRWSREGGVAQVSCFFSPNAYVTTDTFQEFEHSLDNALLEASITSESTNPGARLWADAYSADGKIYLASDKTSMEADAIGIGGDFFLFHPLDLITGAYFSGNDVNQDYCVIDQDVAWQLFGSNDVAGMMLYIAGRPHMITGVIRREEGRMTKAAGLDSPRVYVSYQTLNEYGSCNGINHYEIVMPNPVDNFALNLVRERLGGNEKETETLENTSRFGLLNRLRWIGTFGTRSMNGKAIIYPYWENIARGYEDIIGTLTIFMILFLLYPTVVALILFIIWWRHKGWTMRDVFLKGKDKAERRIERMREENFGRRDRKTQKEDLL